MKEKLIYPCRAFTSEPFWIETSDLLACSPSSKLRHSVFSTWRLRPFSCPRIRGSFMLPSMSACTSAAPARFRELGDAVFAEACVPAFWKAAARESFRVAVSKAFFIAD